MTFQRELKFDRPQLEQLLLKRFFITPSFAIYGGVAGLYDYGPPGTALQNNIIQLWRQFFVVAEDMLELDTTALTPHDVLETSGHVDKFADWMVKDPETGEFFRADHFVEKELEKRIENGGVKEVKTKVGKKLKSEKIKISQQELDEYKLVLAAIDNYQTAEALSELISKYEIRSPETGNEVSPPTQFNLMFNISIGPTGYLKGFLRPETAQGQFVNFKRLLEFNNDRMPFASAQIGKSFRNEISPKNGVLRVREFTMAEIEHYVSPSSKDHHKFSHHKDLKLPFLPAFLQEKGVTEPTWLSLEDAVYGQKWVNNETLGYFLARVYLFLEKLGINTMKGLRFRQHMSNEMAHYACDCWDAEIKTSYGWIECVGNADRSAFDLTRHSERTKEKLVVREKLPEPVEVTLWKFEVNKKLFGPTLKKGAKPVQDQLLAMNEEELLLLKKKLESAGDANVSIVGTDGEEYFINSNMVSISQVTTVEHVKEYTPNVIEPSFGIGRIMYALIEHVWWQREGDEQRQVLSFPPAIAPIKCLVAPLSNSESFGPIVRDIAHQLRQRGISSRIDDSSSSIGRRYARNDELGTPFAVTVDFDTVKDNTVTLRTRDSTQQIRGPIPDILSALEELVQEKRAWAEYEAMFGLITTELQ